MGNKKGLLILLAFIFILLAPVKVYAYSDPLDVLNNLVGPSETYNSMVTPAYTRTNTVGDYINPQTGELNLTQTDYVLPGVNGLDLEIKRIYKSGSDTLFMDKAHYDNGVLVEYADNSVSQSNNYLNTFYEMRYNLGCGWRFSFPTIEQEGSFLYLHTETGDVYSLTGPDQNGVYTIVNHPVQDLTVQTCSDSTFTSQGINVSGQNYDMHSHFVMTDKNGKKTYFDSAGRILGIVDRYGNHITFQYKDLQENLYDGPLTKTLISKIIDTMGRVVTIDYPENTSYKVSVNDTNLHHNYQVVITLPNQKTIVYDKSWLVYIYQSLQVARTRLQMVYDVDATLPITDNSPYKYWYGYEQANLGFTYFQGSTYSTTYGNENINEVKSGKTNQDKKYSYGDVTNPMYRFVKPLSYSYYTGSMEYRKVVDVQDVDQSNGTTKNDLKYSYTNDPQGYTYHSDTGTWSLYPGYKKDDQDYQKNTYRYSAKITDGRGALITYTYDGLGETVNVEKTGNDHHDSMTTTYDPNKLPQKIQTVSYNVVNGADGNSVTKTENYVYDGKGNLTQYTGPEANRDSNGNPTGNTYTTPENTTVNEHTVVYTYDPTFSILTSKTWKQDASTVSRIECTVDSANGNVTQMRNIHTGNNILTDFQYDGLGNMTQKTVHYADNSGNAYTTNYVYGTEEDGVDRGGTSAKYNGLYYGGAYLTRVYSTADGTQVSKKYIYDFNTGNKTADIDENNNWTDYTYDLFNRLTIIKYPDQTTKQYDYYDDSQYTDYYGNSAWNREILYTDPNNNKFLYVYDILGNLVLYSTYGFYDNTNKWKVLRQMTYDANNNKTKEMDAYGHSSQFAYDSANRLIEKSFWANDSTKTKSMTLQYTVGADSNTPLLLTITDEDGYIKKYHYDLLNRLVQLEVTPDKTNFYATNYTYDYTGHKKTEADAYNNTTSYTYDDLGRLTDQTDARSHKTQNVYDAGGKLIQQINPRGKSTFYDYDIVGRLIRKKEPASDGSTAITRYIYDATGNKLKEITPNNYNQTLDTPSQAASMTGVSYTYDNMNRLITTVSPEGSLIEIRSYDKNGNVQKVVDGLRYNGTDINTSPGTTFVYDAFNRKISQTDALNNVQSFTYLLTGQLKTSTDANNHTVTNDYYPDGTLHTVTYPDNGMLTYTYDNRGNKTSVTDQRGNVTNYSFNGFGKIATQTDALQNQITYNYYNNGNLASVQDQRGHYTYYSYYPDNDLQQKKTDIDGSHYAEEDYVTDECGNVTQKTLTGNVDGSSRVTTYTYYDNNLLQSTTDTSSTDNSGSYSKKYYDKDRNLIKEEIRRDASSSDNLKYAYDSLDRKTQSIKLVDEAAVYNASLLPNIANLRDTDYSGKIQLITGYVYDVLGNLTATVDPRAYGFLATDTANRNLYTINNAYDSLNRLQTVTKMLNGASISTKYFYDAVGNKKAVRDESGHYTVYTYDSMNRPLTYTDSETDTSLKSYSEAQIITLAGQATNTLAKTVTNAYDQAGNKISVIDANGYMTNYVYDKLNRLQTVKAPYDPGKPEDPVTNPYNQVTEERVYDENGNLVKRIDAKGYQSGGDDSSRYGTEYTYDFANHLLTILDPEGKCNGLQDTTQYSYNQYGDKIKQTDACNNSTNYKYDSAGKLIKVTDACSVDTNYYRDNAGNVLTQTDGRGKATHKAYGTGSLLLTVTDANNNTTTYKYDLAGNIADLTDRNGNDTLMTYDLRNQVLSKTVSQTGDTISFTYDSAGNRATMNDASGAYYYSYDANNRLLGITKGVVPQITYAYDKIGNVRTVTDNVSGFTTTYTYDTANRMSTVSYDINGNKTVTYSYDLNGNRQAIAYPGNITESYQYDKNNRLLSLTNTAPSGTVSSYSYTYYNNGLQNTKTDSYGITTYLYDGDGRVTNIAAPGKTTTYSYDNAGNRQSMDETYTSDQYSGYLDPVSNTNITYKIKHSDYLYGDPNNLVQLTEMMKDSSGTEVLRRVTNYQYDKNGNQITQEVNYLQPSSAGESYNVTNYGNTSTSFDRNLERTENTYDGFNRLSKVDAIKAGSRVTSEFTYNGDDLRVKKIVKKSDSNYTPEETDYLYDGQFVILETDGGNNVKTRYILGVNYLGRVDASNQLSYFLFNGHGDVVQNISENGTVENQYDYDVFGNPTLSVEPQYASNVRYAGEFYDNETGLYYLRARYYNPGIGRFISEDTYSGSTNDPLSLNLYTYCYNDPLMYSDPTGHMPGEGPADGGSYGGGNTGGSSSGSADHLPDGSTIYINGISGNGSMVVNGNIHGGSLSITVNGGVDIDSITPGEHSSVGSVTNNGGLIWTISTGNYVNTSISNSGLIGSIITGDHSITDIENSGIIGSIRTGTYSTTNIANFGSIGTITTGNYSITDVYKVGQIIQTSFGLNAEYNDLSYLFSDQGTGKVILCSYNQGLGNNAAIEGGKVHQQFGILAQTLFPKNQYTIYTNNWISTIAQELSPNYDDLSYSVLRKRPDLVINVNNTKIVDIYELKPISYYYNASKSKLAQTQLNSYIQPLQAQEGMDFGKFEGQTITTTTISDTPDTITETTNTYQLKTFEDKPGMIYYEQTDSTTRVQEKSWAEKILEMPERFTVPVPGIEGGIPIPVIE